MTTLLENQISLPQILNVPSALLLDDHSLLLTIDLFYFIVCVRFIKCVVITTFSLSSCVSAVYFQKQFIVVIKVTTQKWQSNDKLPYIIDDKIHHHIIASKISTNYLQIIYKATIGFFLDTRSPFLINFMPYSNSIEIPPTLYSLLP